MAIVRNLIVRAGADFSELQKQMQKAQKFMKSAGKQLTEVGKTLTVGVTLPIVGIGTAAVKSASDLKEVQNVIDTAFGKSAKSVDAWAKSTIKNYGLSELQAKQFAGTMRAMTGSMGLSTTEADKMSISLAGLAGDMASFYNLDPSEAFDKLKSGISGETEPLRSLGVNMSVANLQAYALSKGIKKSWKEMTAAEQATLRYNYIMDNTKMAQGDFAKTNTSFANSLRVVKNQLVSIGAQFGSILLPYLETFLGKLRSVLDAIQNLTPAQQQMIVKFALIAAAIGPALMVLGKLTTGLSGALGWMGKVSGALAGIAKGTKTVGSLLMAVFSPAGIVLIVLAAIAALVAGFIYLYKTNEDFRNKVQEIWTSIVNFLTPVFQSIQQVAMTVWGQLQQFWTDNSAAIMDLFKSTWDAILSVLSAVWNVIKAIAIPIFNALKSFWANWGSTIINSFKITWDTISGVFKGVINVISGIMKIISGIVSGDWNKVWEGAKQVFIGIWDAIKSILKGAVNFIINIINKLISGINKIHFKLPDWAGGKSFGINIPKIPMLAAGGIVTKPTLAMIGEGSENEAVLPLSKLEKLINIKNKDEDTKQTQYNAPLFVIESFVNNNESDIEKLMYQMEFYRKKAALAHGGV